MHLLLTILAGVLLSATTGIPPQPAGDPAQETPSAETKADDPFRLVVLRPDGRAGVKEAVRSPETPTLVAIFTTWCEPCVTEIPVLKKLHEEGKRRGLRVVGVSVDDASPRKVLGWMRKHQITYPVLYADSDTRLGRSPLGDTSNLPTMILFSAKGTLLRRWVGVVPERILRAALEPILKPEP